MRLHSERMKLAEAIRDRLPWAHVVVGATGYQFIIVNHGEVIRGFKDLGHGGSKAWSRPLPGSMYLLWEACRLEMSIVVHDEPHFESLLHERRRIAERTIARAAAPRRSGRGWIEEAADHIANVASLHLVPVPRTRYADLLREGERVEVKADREVAS